MARRSDAIERFTEEAEASGLQVEVQRYPDGTRTAADAAAADAVPPTCDQADATQGVTGSSPAGSVCDPVPTAAPN